MANFTNPENGKTFKVDVAKYDRMTTEKLIITYDAINEVKFNRDYYRNKQRISYIVDLISARAESDDPVAMKWYEN